MRRLLSILLLFGFGMPLVSPLFALSAHDKSNLPACCRRNGAHHCMSGMQLRPDGDDQAGFLAPLEHCPYCPGVLVAPNVVAFAAPQGQSAFASLIGAVACAAHAETNRRIARNGSRHKRGPPAMTLL